MRKYNNNNNNAFCSSVQVRVAKPLSAPPFPTIKPTDEPKVKGSKKHSIKEPGSLRETGRQQRDITDDAGFCPSNWRVSIRFPGAFILETSTQDLHSYDPIGFLGCFLVVNSQELRNHHSYALQHRGFQKRF